MTIQKLAYTFDEAAEQSGYSVRTLKQAVADGNLAARYANSKGVIRHEDLAAWLDALPAEPPGGIR
ncbi:helix-turn-helix domain-containing protein [Arthrobacter sp. IA7]|uniref:helix-turn-helix domain-containing protein n=1 Tax=Arthrobacter ipis TaxID=2716202 RepID=UPI001684C0B9|nr:helix-turn-helix domain-containing protein [Arthrobacter ipis]MBD1540996.1 helix-turn-helix domain-containing protein [Arthrobacter ipis]